MSDVVLDVRNLNVEFPTRKGVLTAVDNTSLHIWPGEIPGMVSMSGAGKSMTGMAILGLREPTGQLSTGSIHLSGDGSTHSTTGRWRRCAAAGSVRSFRTRSRPSTRCSASAIR